MALTVVSFCGYLCNQSMSWRPEDFDSYKWVQTLKGHDVNKCALVPVRGNLKRLSNANASDALDWFGQFVADYLKKQQIEGPFYVVPVPNSDCTAAASKPRTKRLAKAICNELSDGSQVLDCLRWKKNLGSASKEGGPRDAEILYENMNILKEETNDLDEDRPVLLVDDVTTSGGHLRACAAKLSTKGIKTEIVLCGGKTVYDQTRSAFHICEDKIQEFKP